MTVETTEVTTEQPTTPVEPPSPLGPASRDDLIAAVRAAGGVESVDVDAEAAAAGRPPPAVDPEPAPAPEPPNRLDAIMKAREERHKETEVTRSRARNIEDEAQRRAEQIIRDAEERAKKVVDETLAQHKAQFSTSPTAALRALGLDSQEAIDAVLAENTPQAKALAEARREAALAREDAKIGRTAKEEFDRFKAEQVRAREVAEAQAYQQNYLATVASAEKAPHLHARFDAPEIVQKSYDTATAWVNDGLKYGIDFDDADVVAYLEKQSKERLSKFAPTTPPAPQVSAGAPVTAPGNAPKVQANGPRTLSAAQGSERRSAPKPFHQLNAAEKKAALIEEVAAARRLNPDAD